MSNELQQLSLHACFLFLQVKQPQEMLSSLPNQFGLRGTLWQEGFKHSIEVTGGSVVFILAVQHSFPYNDGVLRYLDFKKILIFFLLEKVGKES